MRALDITTAPKRDSRHWKGGTVEWCDILGWMEKPGWEKEAGNYVLGRFMPTQVIHKGGRTPCSAIHRTKQAVVSRSALALDADSPGPDFLDNLEGLGLALLWHTTFSSTPDAPRYRVLVPLDRDITPGEYHAAALTVMNRVGIEHWDPGSVQPERYMFKPATPRPDWFSWGEMPGEKADASTLVAETPTLEAFPTPQPPKRKRSPFEMPGVIGAFNRVYERLEDLVEAYDLPYEHVSGDRWTLVGASAAAGMGEMAPGLWFSHHAHDPAVNRACTAFDLVRLHRYADLDEEVLPDTPVNRMPSHQAMLEDASTDPKVVGEIVGADFKPDASALAANDGASGTNGASNPPPPSPAPSRAPQPGPDAWRNRLAISTTGNIRDTIANWDLIAEHDAVFQSLNYNVLTLAMEAESDLPWRPVDAHHGGVTFSENDCLNLMAYVERTYGVRPTRARIDQQIARRRAAHRLDPVRRYLENLPEWDGEERVETCLPGVHPTPFTRLAARKCLVAAVARVFEPGVKWDHSLVLYGEEGLGKSYWVQRMAQGFTSTLGRVDNKDTLIVMNRSWVVLADEGHSMRKADADMLKEFLTRTHDVFRMPYDREAAEYPRRCVIWTSTNEETFLRRQEGNRRFLIVKCEEKVDFQQMTPEWIDQVWAEALVLYKRGELLFLEDEESTLASTEREKFTEDDALGGMIGAFLDMPVEDDWGRIGPEGRALYWRDYQSGLTHGDIQQTETCALQIWVEVLGNSRGMAPRVELSMIHESLKRLPGWRKAPRYRRVLGYGVQQVYERYNEEEDLI